MVGWIHRCEGPTVVKFVSPKLYVVFNCFSLGFQPLGLVYQDVR